MELGTKQGILPINRAPMGIDAGFLVTAREMIFPLRPIGAVWEFITMEYIHLRYKSQIRMRTFAASSPYLPPVRYFHMHFTRHIIFVPHPDAGKPYAITITVEYKFIISIDRWQSLYQPHSGSARRHHDLLSG